MAGAEEEKMFSLFQINRMKQNANILNSAKKCLTILYWSAGFEIANIF